MKNSNDTIWNRTSDLPICSTAPQSLCYRGPHKLEWFYEISLEYAHYYSCSVSKTEQGWISFKFGINDKYSTDSVWTPMIMYKPHFIQKRKMKTKFL